MKHDRDTRQHPGRRRIGLTVTVLGTFALASVIVLLSGLVSLVALRTAGNEIKTMREAVDGNAAAVADSLVAQTDKAAMLVTVGSVAGVGLLAVVFFYLAAAIIRPLRVSIDHMRRLAVGDSGGDAPADQLARNDELGDLARAIRDLTAYQREEVAIANEMSAGDFTGTVTVRDPADRLGLAIQRMAGLTVDTLRRVSAHVGQVMRGCEAIATASGELSANSADITAAVSEITDGIERIRSHAGDNAGVADQAGRLAGAGSHSVERGYEDIGEMGVVMLNMQACGDKIVGIAKSIGDIAFQTNLLALNARVEAARAGQHGKGFTIVADEVRRLAVRSSQAAEETSTLMKDTVEQVELAAAIAGRINATFAEMQGNIHEAEALMTRIADASREQTGGIELISEALRRMDQSARENVAHVDGVLERARRLVGQTGELGRVMGRFVLVPGTPPDSDGSARPGAGRPARPPALTWSPGADPRMTTGAANWKQ